MAPKTHGLRATVLATLVAFAGVAAFSAPVAAVNAPVAASDPAAAIGATEPAIAITPAPRPVPTAPPAPISTAAPTAGPVSAFTATPIATPAPAAAAPVARPNIGARIVRIAKAQRGKRYAPGAVGPSAFDCSGLVLFAYRRAGVSRHLGGGHSARGMLLWARRHHLASKTNPRIGDVVIYGNGTHAGIYIGHGLVISALNSRLGIRITGLRALTTPFTEYIHTHV